MGTANSAIVVQQIHHRLDRIHRLRRYPLTRTTITRLFSDDDER
jgi:hypothetical protein